MLRVSNNTVIIFNIDCYFIVQGNNFTSNVAESNGGAIYYNWFSPTGLRNNTYSNNFAQYGPDYGSYAFKMAVIPANQI